MRPVRTIIAVVFVAAVAVTGCAAHSMPPSSVPSSPVVDQPPMPPLGYPALSPAPAPAPKPTLTPKVAIDRAPVPADGHYDSYIRTVDPNRQRLVVDLVQVFQGQAAVDATIADGRPRDQAEVLDAYIRNQNPRLRTLPMASDLRIDLVGRGDCGAGSNLQHDMDLLISDVDQHTPSLYFTLTATSGAVRHIKEVSTQPAC